MFYYVSLDIKVNPKNFLLNIFSGYPFFIFSFASSNNPECISNFEKLLLSCGASSIIFEILLLFFYLDNKLIYYILNYAIL